MSEKMKILKKFVTKNIESLIWYNSKMFLWINCSFLSCWLTDDFSILLKTKIQNSEKNNTKHFPTMGPVAKILKCIKVFLRIFWKKSKYVISAKNIIFCFKLKKKMQENRFCYVCIFFPKVLSKTKKLKKKTSNLMHFWRSYEHLKNSITIFQWNSLCKNGWTKKFEKNQESFFHKVQKQEKV